MKCSCVNPNLLPNAKYCHLCGGCTQCELCQVNLSENHGNFCHQCGNNLMQERKTTENNDVYELLHALIRVVDEKELGLLNAKLQKYVPTASFVPQAGFKTLIGGQLGLKFNGLFYIFSIAFPVESLVEKK